MAGWDGSTFRGCRLQRHGAYYAAERNLQTAMFYLVRAGRGYAAAARGLPWLEQYPVGHGLSASRRFPQRCPHDPSDGNAGKDAMEHHGGAVRAPLTHAIA